MKNKKSAIRGIKSSIIASLCCITPLVVVLLGVGGISIALSFLRYRIYFLGIGVMFLFLATYIYLKRDYGKCNYSIIKKEKNSIIISVVFMAIVYVVLTYFIIPPLLISATESTIQKSQPASAENTKEMKVLIEGMTCSCNVADLEYNIMQIKGVLNASIDYEAKHGLIKYDPDKTNPDTILKSEILSSSYKATIVQG